MKFVGKKLNKEIKMKKFLVVLLMSLATVVSAQTFPSKPVRIITSLPAGSGPDNIARKLAEKLSAKWGVPVTVDNRPGGAGAVMFNAYADTPADGYTVILGDAGNFVGYPILYNKPDALADVEPLTGQNMTNMMLVVSPNVKDFADLKTKLKANPTYASGGTGSPLHLVGQEFASTINIDAKHVPYKDYGALFVDVSNGTVIYTFAAIGSSMQLVESGKLKYLAYAGNTRNPDYPNVPTVNELTKQNKTPLRAWVVYYIKKSAPAEAKAVLAKDISSVMKTPEMQSLLKTLGYQYPPATPEELAKFVNGEATVTNELIKKYNISIK